MVPKIIHLWSRVSVRWVQINIKNGCFTKQPSKFGCLGHQLGIITILLKTLPYMYIYILYTYIKSYHLNSGNCFGESFKCCYIVCRYPGCDHLTFLRVDASPPAIHGAPSGHEEAAVVVGGCRFRAGGGNDPKKKNKKNGQTFLRNPNRLPPPHSQRIKRNSLDMLRSHEDFKITDCWETAQTSMGSN